MKRAALLMLMALTLAACGDGPAGGAPVRTAGVAVLGPAPAIRALLPLDADGDGIADSVPHPETRRLVLQAPPGTPIRLLRGGIELPFEASRLDVPGGTIHELQLAAPLGTQPVTLNAGAYSLSIQANAELAPATAPTFRPQGRGAYANDLLSANGAVFESADDVSLLLGGALPPLIGPGLFLQSGQGTAISLLPRLTRAGVMLTPQSRPVPDIAYMLKAPEGALDGVGQPLAPDFRLVCRLGRSVAAIRLATADIDRDGNLDLLCLFADGSLSLLRDATGPAESVLPPSPGRAIDFACGDFDGNGTRDIAVLRADETGFSILYMLNETRRADVRWSMYSEKMMLEQPAAMRAADFDRDGRDDLAVLDDFGSVFLIPSATPRRMLAAAGTRKLALRLLTPDANGDGRPDIAVLCADGTLRVSLNPGASGFADQLETWEVTVPGAQRAAFGALDGDRNADFIFTGFRGAAALLGGQDQAAPLVIDTAETPIAASGAAVIRDMNRDSRNDVLVAREDAEGISDDIAVFMNSEEPRATPDTLLPLGARLRIHAMEFWRDCLWLATDSRLLFLKVNAEALPPTAASKVRFMEGYAPVPQIPAPLAAAIADFNDDGRADIAAIDRDGKLRIWLSGQPGEPFVAAGEAVLLGGAGMLKAIDFDHDGKADLLFIPTDSALKPRVLRNTGRGEMDASENGMLPTPPTGLRGAPALGDFDLDGDLDVLWPSAFGRVQFNDGAGGWRDGRNIVEIREPGGMRLQFSGELACADFTGDGIADIAAVMRVSEDTGSPNYLVLLQGTGVCDDGTTCFRVILSEQIRGRIFKLTPADFDNDGRVDLALGYAPEGQDARLTLLRLREDLQFTPFEGSPSAKGRLLDLALDDMDRDGDLDLIASEDLPGKGIATTLWVNNGKGRYVEGGTADDSLKKALGEFKATNLSLADFTGDGRSDLLAVDSSGNVILVRSYLP